VISAHAAGRSASDNRAMDLRQRALELLCLADPWAKASGTRQEFNNPTSLTIDAAATLPEPAGLPGRPARPALVSPANVPRRSLHTAQGRAALLHAVAHIEFNAINLALDAVWRFERLPDAYYRDWLRVASEEAHHFSLLVEHLASLGHAYGDFDAHDGLWSMVEKTKHDIVARMALVPRTLEARGLDATPPMQAKLAQAGDARAVEILGVILRDEVGHVAIGNRWYRWLCEREGLDPIAHFEQLLVAHHAPRPKPPFNFDARRRAGFDEEELARLTHCELRSLT
jgi:uncharacterized ferritin-like protein (DUF455 family)